MSWVLCDRPLRWVETASKLNLVPLFQPVHLHCTWGILQLSRCCISLSPTSVYSRITDCNLRLWMTLKLPTFPFAMFAVHKPYEQWEEKDQKPWRTIRSSPKQCFEWPSLTVHGLWMCCGCVAPLLAALKIEFGRSTTKFFLALRDCPPPLPWVTASIPGTPLWCGGELGQLESLCIQFKGLHCLTLWHSCAHVLYLSAVQRRGYMTISMLFHILNQSNLMRHDVHDMLWTIRGGSWRRWYGWLG